MALPRAFRAPSACLASALLCGALAACGGGGGGGAATEPPPVDVSAVAAADPGTALPASWKNGAFMEIHVRAYKDSDGDGKGDLRGLIQSLDYLQGLGITGLWLMPVTDSQDRDHGYSVSNYRGIERDYGSLADFDELLAQAHARGIGVIIDYVINHSAFDNPIFAHSRNSTANAYRDWYVWQAVVPAGWSIFGSNPWYGAGTGAYFAAFFSQMPDFNLRNTQVLDYHRSNLRFWLNRGVDGFRFDAVGNLVENGPAAWENQPENDEVMNAMRQVVAGYANRYMVCEAPGAPQRYAAPTSCGGSFAFGQQFNMVNATSGDVAAVAATATYYNTGPTNPSAATLAGFLSNHDSFASFNGNRVWDWVGGNAARYRLAAATNLLQSTTPFIYYGEEIGMAGGAGLSGDPKLRTPMSWNGNAVNAGFTTGRPFRALSANVAANNVAAQEADANSLLSFYKAVISLRKSRPSLMSGSYVAGTANGTLASFRRVLGAEQTLVVFNYGSTPATATIDGLPAGVTLPRLWPASGGAGSVDVAGQARIDLQAQSFAVFAVGP
ncbi:Alpha amylase catalytic region [Rubrivivax sp. A210]|uniref:alpha-amylase family glycosyl hydrolase n=1 Tax=Rubrivivax sp. A210 TaxID=2772301 RepID=UPI001917E2D7|nr:alpha-amylase family glycosyl hydrolase [Rubrivivax sp. A210]CAD5366240.1 Alpha amylase catalytic region [Rubrivivax sp. A210]